jgi:hypothetical protein
MSITPGNLSLVLSVLSSVAPGTWALVAGIFGLLFGFFGKQLLKHYDSLTSTRNPKPPATLSRRSSTGRAANPRRSKKSPPASSN